MIKLVEKSLIALPSLATLVFSASICAAAEQGRFGEMVLASIEKTDLIVSVQDPQVLPLPILRDCRHSVQYEIYGGGCAVDSDEGETRMAKVSYDFDSRTEPVYSKTKCKCKTKEGIACVSRQVCTAMKGTCGAEC